MGSDGRRITVWSKCTTEPVVRGTSSRGGPYVLVPHDVVEGELGTPGGLVEGGAAGATVRRASRLLHDVLRQGEHALLGLLDQVRLDVVAPQEVVAVLPMSLLHLVVAVQTIQSCFRDVDSPRTEGKYHVSAVSRSACPLV